jgi:membrane-associated HD superfamily phosphohydrolase
MDDFRYNFPKPQTKEAAIIMLADTVEAAVRSKITTVKDSSEVETFVRQLVRDKQEDGQLSESPLTLGDIEVVIQSFLRVFKGMYHERIAYPKQDDEK